MKKILTMALALGAVASMSAQKATVDQAAKMSGKLDKVAEARALIQEAMNNPETANDVRTYYTAGKIEFDAFDEGFKKRAINPNDAAVDVIEMGKELVNGYNQFIKALPLDQVPNEKGQVKPKYTKDMVGKMKSHHNDYFNYGGEMFNNKHYYPEAYEAFMIYGDMPSQDWADKSLKAVPDSMIAMAYHYAGIGAFSGAKDEVKVQALKDALKAFSKAREAGITNPQNYVYEIACWQNIAMEDSTMEQPARHAIYDIAKHGYDTFGITDHLFINNLINTMLQDSKYDEALALIDKQIAQTPDQPFLFGLRGYVNDRKGDNDASVADYRKAASFQNADVETLKNAAKKIYTTGTTVWNSLETKTPDKIREVKNDYFVAAKNIADRAKAIDAEDPDLDYVLENINYALDTYFSNY